LKKKRRTKKSFGVEKKKNPKPDFFRNEREERKQSRRICFIHGEKGKKLVRPIACRGKRHKRLNNTRRRRGEKGGKKKGGESLPSDEKRKDRPNPALS